MTTPAIAQPHPPAPHRPIHDYLSRVGRAVATTFEGLAVTTSWMFRRPMTIQYPDRMDRPVQETLPEKYRGTLEVDLDRCTGCLLCAKACPIDCIAIGLAKNAAGVRELVKFDIDIGSCMYCGLCVEQCKFDSLVHTNEFEQTAVLPDDLVLHFATKPQPVSKHKSGEGPARRRAGTILVDVVRACFGRGLKTGKNEKS